MFKSLNLTLLTLISISFHAPLSATPIGEQVIAGDVTVQRNDNQVTITQTSQSGIVHWQRFDVGANESVHFAQPLQGVTLNRILDTSAPSQILGRLSSTGHVFLLNSAGIVFGNTAQIDVGGLVASTGHITNENFLQGKYLFSQNGSQGSIANYGHINARDGGFVGLFAPEVANHGIIQARLGNVVLGSGNEYTLDLFGDGLVEFSLGTGSASSMKITNSGSIKAHGGHVLLTTGQAHGVIDRLISVDGVIEANHLSEQNGEIILSHHTGGSIDVSGQLHAKGGLKGGDGGLVKISSKHIALTGDIDTSAAHGRDGRALIAPLNIDIVPGGSQAIYNNSSVLNADIISSIQGNLSIQATGYITQHHGANLNFYAPGQSLTMQAGGNITINGMIQTHGGMLHLEANSPHIASSARFGFVQINGKIKTYQSHKIQSGQINLIGEHIIAYSGSTDAGTSDIQIAFVGDNALDPVFSGLKTQGKIILGHALSAGKSADHKNVTQLTNETLQTREPLFFRAEQASEVVLIAKNGIALNTSVTANQDLTIYTDFDGDGIGILSVNNSYVQNHNHNINIHSNDINMSRVSFIDAGLGKINLYNVSKNSVLLGDLAGQHTQLNLAISPGNNDTAQRALLSDRLHGPRFNTINPNVAPSQFQIDNQELALMRAQELSVYTSQDIKLDNAVVPTYLSNVKLSNQSSTAKIMTENRDSFIHGGFSVDSLGAVDANIAIHVAGLTHIKTLDTTNINLEGTNINITSAHISGKILGKHVQLVGTNGIDQLQIDATESLTLGGQSGGELFGRVKGIDTKEAALETTLDRQASGNFYVNNCLVGSGSCEQSSVRQYSAQPSETTVQLEPIALCSRKNPTLEGDAPGSFQSKLVRKCTSGGQVNSRNFTVEVQ